MSTIVHCGQQSYTDCMEVNEDCVFTNHSTHCQGHVTSVGIIYHGEH